MRSFMLLLSVLVVSCFVFSPVLAVDTAQEEADIQAIKEILVKWDDALNSGDANAILNLLTEDVILLNPDGPITEGKKACKASISADFEKRSFANSKTVVVEVRLAGDRAYSRGTWSGTITPKDGGDSFQESGRLIDIFERQPDGSWKVSCEMYSIDLPVPESAD